MVKAVDSEPPTDIVVLGKVVAPYGLNGAVKVFPFADDPLAWSKLPCWWIGREGEDPSRWQRARLVQCKVREALVIADLDCSPDRNAAEAMQGSLVGIPRAELPATAKDEYYWADLLGLDVVNTHDQSLGRVLGLIETPANDVLRVGDGVAQERLLPFVATVVLDVDRAVGQIRVDWELDL